MRSHFCEETTGSQEMCAESPGKNQTQNCGCFRHSWVILDFIQLKYWFFVALNATRKLCHLAGCWCTPESHTANQELMFAWLPLWSPAILSTERKYSSGSQLLPGFLLCWAADSWCPVWIINTTHGFCLISTCHKDRQHLPPLQFTYLFGVNRAFVYWCDAVPRWSCTLQPHRNLT